MRVRIHWIDGVTFGRVGIMPRPRGGDWLEDEVRSLCASGVDVVVSLLEREEITELDVVNEQAFCETNGIRFLSFPIKDRGVPPLNRETVDFIRMLAEILSEGKTVVIHCRQGVGRSALIAASVLVVKGLDVNLAFERVAAARGCPVPDTQEQREWVDKFARTHSSLG